MNERGITSNDTVEQLTAPLEFEDRNTIIGLMRIAAGREGVHEYQRLKAHVDAYTGDEPTMQTRLFVARSAIIAYGMLDHKPEVVGFAATRLQHSEEGIGVHVEGLYVSPIEQNRGHGRALARAVIGFATDIKAAYVQLDRPYTNMAAQRLFSALDFTTEHSEFPRLHISQDNA